MALCKTAPHNSAMKRLLILLLAFGYGLSGPSAHGAEGGYCGDEGVWIQLLGAGGPELNDGQSGPSYLVWLNNQARLLVDTAPGSSTQFDRAGAKFEDLDAIVFTHLRADQTADFPSFVKGSQFAERGRPLTVLGPDGNDEYPDTETFIARLIGPDGAYPNLADFLTYRSSGGYKINPRNVPATGRRRWSRFGTSNLRLAAIPVHHSNVPAIAWRVEIGGQILEAEGRREAAFRDAEARERQAEAEAKATQMVSDAIAKGEMQAINYFVAQKYVDALKEFAASPNQKTFFLPVEATGILSSLGGITELIKTAGVDGDAGARGAGPNGSGGGRRGGTVPSSTE